MPSKPRTRAQIIDQAESFLQDNSNGTFSVAEIGLIADDVITEISESVPYIMRDIYQIESRRGQATSTSANNLVDATNAQFASGDTGKIVYNTTDKTWAVITSYSSTSQVGLSKDIFTSGEGYEVYNKGCFSSKQINIENSDDYLKILYVEYPFDRSDYWYPFNNRNVIKTDRNNIVEIDVAYVDNTKNTNADKDVAVYFAKQHKLNSMTDLAGAVNNGAGYAAGSTSIAMDGLGNTETIYKDTLFTVALSSGISSRLVYRVTADVTTSGNAATVSLWPGLESAVVDDAVVTFVGSTLTPDLDRIAVKLISGLALMSKSITNINNIVVGDAVSQKQYSTGKNMVDEARRQLKAKIDVELKANHVYSRG